MEWKNKRISFRAGNWSRVKNGVIDDPTLPATAKLVYWAICRTADNHTVICHKSHSYLATMLGIHRTTVIRSIKILIEEGYIERIKGTGESHPNWYRLCEKDPKGSVAQDYHLDQKGSVANSTGSVANSTVDSSTGLHNQDSSQDSLQEKENFSNSSSGSAPKGIPEEFQKERKKKLGHIRTSQPRTPKPKEFDPEERKELEKTPPGQDLSHIAEYLTSVNQ